MVHYPLIMRMAGPLINMQCLKYELKHAFSKRLAAVNCNFKNIPKSVASKHQVMQCAIWSTNGEIGAIECNGDLVSVDTLEGADTIRTSLGIDEDSDVFVAHWVTVFGTEYRPGLLLVTGIENDMPQFAKICRIVVQGKRPKDVTFVLKSFDTVDFVQHYHAYSISATQIPEYKVMTFEELDIEHPPLSDLGAYDKSKTIYVSLRHIVKKGT